MIPGVRYEGRRMVSEADGTAVGHYHQDGELVWAEFAGGPVRSGRLVGTCDSHGNLDAAYCQVLFTGEVIAGRVTSAPTTLPDGRLRLTESWRRHDGSTGVSAIEEMRP